MNKLKKFVALALVLCMVLSVMPVQANAASEDFLRVYHLDCGRKYFEIADVEELIDLLSEQGYTHLELALGNDGLRLILDDMSVLSYDSAAVAAGIKTGNENYSHAGEWSQAQMDAILDYAAAKNIEIIPLINTPGHMDAILEAMEAVGIYGSYNGSARTVDVTNAKAVEFTQALVAKYVDYFAEKGCTYFNMGADEYANDIYTSGSMGFGHLQSYGLYDEYAAYINGMAGIIKEAGITPIAFNDGLYFNGSSVAFDTDIVVAYWTAGWGSYRVAAASTLAAKGHKILNTNDGWYYVLGRDSDTYGYYSSTLNGVQNVSVTDVPGSNDPAPIGAMACLWCDEPGNSYAGSKSKVQSQITLLAENNPDYFVKSEKPTVPTDPTDPADPEEKVLTDDATGVILVGPNLTGMTVSEAAAPAIEGADKVMAWNIVPETAEGKYTGAAEVSVPVPEDYHIAWLGALVVNDDGSVTKLEGGYNNGYYTYTAPHFSVTGIYGIETNAENPDQPVETEEKTISLGIGTAATDTITGGEYAADETELDKSIATVSVKTSPAQEATVTYTEASVEIADLLDESTSTATNTGYYYLVGGSYYPLYATRSFSYSSYRYTYTWYYTTDNGSSFTRIGTQTAYYTNAEPNITVYAQTGVEAKEASTTVTFQGVSKGTTYVTVGNVRYTIHVSDAPPSNALTGSSVTLEYWITNLRVTCNGATSTTIQSTADGVGTAEGVALSSVAGATGKWDYGDVVYWMSVRLDNDHRQEALAEDRTQSGTTMTHIRYYSGAWQYKTTDDVWHYFLSGDQLVSYYLMPTEVTDQITTLTKDWGSPPATNTEHPAEGQVALSFAVVDAGTLTPAEEDIFDKSTVIFNYWNNRDIGVVAPVSNENYEVYKITVTAGVRSSGSSGTQSSWNTGAPTWEKTTNDLGTGEWFDEREVWNISEGTDPMVNGKLDNVIWPAKDTAFLILFYVRATNANLTVRYVDDSLAGATITERGVFADQGESFFDLEQSSAVPNADGPFTLDDDASLTYYNYETEKYVTQHFEKSLLNFQDIQPQYRSGAYEYVGAELADNGKTLILHYNINDKVLKPRFVVDFGLTVSVPMDDIVANYGTSDVTDVRVMNAAYGTASIANGKLTYVPNAILQSAAAVTLRVSNSNGTTTIFNVGFVPASTMYYEEGFAAFTGSWSGGSTGSGEQALQDSMDTEANYGFDGKYADETGKSNGTEAVSSAAGDRAELSFTGTGIDVYANCDTTTSTMIALLYGADGKMVKMLQVDTEAKSGTSGITGGQNAASVSLPVVSIQGLDHGSYRLVLQHTKAAGTAGDLRLDGFRVYNTLTADAAKADYPDDEMNPTFLEVRNSVLAGLNVTEQTHSDLYTYVDTLMSQVYEKESNLTGSLVLGGVELNVQDLLENGPKNELFLHPGQSVTFNLGSAKAQIGMKAPMGAASYAIDGITSGTITSGTDLFYDDAKMTGTITIRNTGSTILSVTKLKLFGAENLTALTAEDVAYALSVMGMVQGMDKLERPGAPIANPFADVAEGSFYHDAVMWAVKEGITTGADASHFLPEALCQRASVVTFLWRAAGSPEPETDVNPFVDVTEDSFFYKAVLWAVEQGITTGVDAKHFAPFGNCSRAQVVTFLWRASGCPDASAENPFTDVAQGSFYEEAVLWAVEKGITNGMSSSIFGVDSICNRAQIVTFLYRAK